MIGQKSRDTVARDLFLQRVHEKGHEVEADRVVAQENVYRVDRTTYLMVRTSRFHQGRGVYFFGLTCHIFENFAELPNAVIAFIFSDSGEALLVPAQWLWQRRNKLSADVRQFKLEVDKSLRLKVLKEAGQPIDLSTYHECFRILESQVPVAPTRLEPKSVLRAHSEIQGMLLEVGNTRGFETYCPNKSPRFGTKALGQIATVRDFPEFPGLNNNMVRQIDVIWFSKSFPIHAFEVELTTGIWSGLVRLAELKRLNTVFHIVTAGDELNFKRRVAGDIFADIVDRCHHASAEEVRALHETEMHLSDLRRRLCI